MASINNFVNYKDFDVKNLRFCNGKANGGYNYRTFEINYEFPDGKTRNLRLRSPVLFSNGVKKYPKSLDYFISLKSFYDEEKLTEKEIKFKETLDSITEFLRGELEARNTWLKRDDLEKIEIINDRGFFFPKLIQDKSYDENGKFTGGKIETNFQEKLENGSLAEVPHSFIEQRNCFVVAFIDISDIFVKSPTLKVRTYLSDVIVIKKEIQPPTNRVKTVGVKLEPKDER